MPDSDATRGTGAKYVGRRVKVVVAGGHEVEAGQGVVDGISVECEELPYRYTAVAIPLRKLYASYKPAGIKPRDVEELLSYRLGLLLSLPDSITHIPSLPAPSRAFADILRQ